MHGPGFDTSLGNRLTVRDEARGHDIAELPDIAGKIPETPVTTTGRRAALGAVAAAVIAVQSFASSADAGGGNDGKRGRRGRRGRKGRRGPQGPQGPRGVDDSTVENGNLAALPVVSVIGNQATSVATCDAGSILLGCGFEVSTTGVGTNPDGALNNTIPDVVPDADDRTCTATLTRTDLISGTITAAAQIRAYAICSA
jgi:hypothetical protein